MRCQKRARVGLHTCSWHADREPLFVPPCMTAIEAPETCPANQGPLVAHEHAIQWDTAFRQIVGLDPVRYWIWVDPTSGWSVIHDDAPPTADSKLVAQPIEHPTG